MRERADWRILLGYILAFPLVLLAEARSWQSSSWALPLAAHLLGLHVTLQLSLFYHELWHNHFFAHPAWNRASYYLLSIFLFLDPQFDRITHSSHHERVHTFDDLEFWPTGRPRSIWTARLRLVFEMFLGKIAWTLAVAPAVWRHPDYSPRRELRFWGVTLTFYTGLGFLSSFWTEEAHRLPLALGINVWIFAVVVRYLQFAEHLGVLAPSLPLLERIHLCRNVRRGSLLASLWHLVTLGDTADHRDHHRYPARPVRAPWPRLTPTSPPSGAQISISHLPLILWSYWRDPFREQDERKE